MDKKLEERKAEPGFRGLKFLVVYTLTYQNLQKSRVPINSILGFIIRAYKKVGFGRLR